MQDCHVRQGPSVSTRPKIGPQQRAEMSMSRLFGSPWSSVLRKAVLRLQKAGCVPDSAPAYGSDAGGEVI